ncbi:MAG: DNA polymerase III subunit chi, partial [Paracoccaceae bacterium]
MAEVLFYHLTQTPLERTLPELLEKSLQRGWRVLVKGGDADRLAFLDGVLWTYRDDSFLPHGVAGEGAEHQPIYLTVDDDEPNNADVLFL